MFGRKSGVDLASFVSGIVRALTKGQQALPKARREQIHKHFTRDDETGEYSPVMSVFRLNDSQAVSVPNFCMSRTNTIGIESATVVCSARIVDVENEDIDCDFSDEKTRVKFHVKPSNPDDKNSFQITINFLKRTDDEAENLLYQSLDNLIEVYECED